MEQAQGQGDVLEDAAVGGGREEEIYKLVRHSSLKKRIVSRFVFSEEFIEEITGFNLPLKGIQKVTGEDCGEEVGGGSGKVGLVLLSRYTFQNSQLILEHFQT